MTARVASVLLLDADKTHDVFDVVEVTDSLVRVRTAYLYEIGEQLSLRISHDGVTRDVTARVRAHTDAFTELDLAA